MPHGGSFLHRDHGFRPSHTLAIDLPAPARYVGLLSIMPHHARFGHAGDPAWISRQVGAPGALLTLEGRPGDTPWIRSIVQFAGSGERVPTRPLPVELN